MSDIAAILTCSGYFLDRPRSHLTRAGGAKAAFVKGVYARDISVRDISGSIYIGIGLSGESCWLLIK